MSPRDRVVALHLAGLALARVTVVAHRADAVDDEPAFLLRALGDDATWLALEALLPEIAPVADATTDPDRRNAAAAAAVRAIATVRALPPAHTPGAGERVLATTAALPDGLAADLAAWHRHVLGARNAAVTAWLLGSGDEHAPPARTALQARDAEQLATLAMTVRLRPALEPLFARLAGAPLRRLTSDFVTQPAEERPQRAFVWGLTEAV